jgi:uncharacterized protein YodC (DUF2158 family)
MASLKFKIGDIVRLLSGGPRMTVDAVESVHHVYAVWFAGEKHERARFHEDTIELAKDVPSKTQKK